MPRLRRRAGGLAGGALVLFIVGTNVQAGWLFVLAAFLLGTILAGWLLPLRMVRRIEVTRSAPVEAFQGGGTPVELVVRNTARGARIGLTIEDAHLAATLAYIPFLAPGEAVRLRTERIPERRGVAGPTAAVVSSAGPFGVAVARRRIEIAGETVVFPVVVRLDDVPFVHAADTHERSVHPYPRMGQGPEFLGVRDYRPGDGLRHVHWPSTARHGSLVVREFEAETTRRLALVVDTCNDLGLAWTPLDRCCSVAASVATAALTEGHGARIIAAREGAPHMLARADPRELLDWLARLRPGGGLQLHELLGSLGDRLRGVETVVLAFPTWRPNDAPNLGPAVARVLATVRSLVAVIVEVDPDAAPAGAVLRSGGVDELAGSLGDLGAEVYRWTPDLPDAAAVLGRRVPVG